MVYKLSRVFIRVYFSVPFSQGQRTSTLSCLIAGGHDDDIAEWSDSMATPPLKIKEPAGGRRNPFQVLMIGVETAFH